MDFGIPSAAQETCFQYPELCGMLVAITVLMSLSLILFFPSKEE